MKKLLTCLISILMVGLLLSDYSFSSTIPKNVILMISDGCGYNHILATNYYQYGKENIQVYENFPVKLGMSTFPIDGNRYDSDKAWCDFKWAKQKYTDSAASGTAIATGVKTSNGYIGVDKDINALKTILERAEELKKSTGVITSVPISHATPAAFIAHHPNRKAYKLIAKQMLTQSSVDVIMGCGHPNFDDNGKLTNSARFGYIGGDSLWNQLKENVAFTDADHDGVKDAWTIIEDRTEFKKMMSGKTPKRVLGIAQVGSTLNCGRDGRDKLIPYEVPILETVPTLAEMSSAALNVLDENKKGFFLMIEGGAIDWASHGNHLGRMIEEEIDFNRSVEAVVKWVEEYSSWDETLVIVTADHETGYLTGLLDEELLENTGDDISEWGQIKNPGKGNLPEVQWNTSGHSNHLVPFFAKGAGCESFVKSANQKDPIRGAYVDNTDISKNIFSLWK